MDQNKIKEAVEVVHFHLKDKGFSNTGEEKEDQNEIINLVGKELKTPKGNIIITKNDEVLIKRLISKGPKENKYSYKPILSKKLIEGFNNSEAFRSALYRLKKSAKTILK